MMQLRWHFWRFRNHGFDVNVDLRHTAERQNEPRFEVLLGGAWLN